MPVEIRELQITAIVEDSGNKAAFPTVSPGDSADIIAKCVEQVLEILKEKSER